MKRLPVRYHIGVGLLLLGLAISACGSGQGDPLLASPTAAGSVAEPLSPTATAPSPSENPGEQQPAPTPDTMVDPRWVVFTDNHWGYSVAVPCWWPIYPAPPQGVAASTSIASYDEAYFMANSVKGAWMGGIAPVGAVKMDLNTMLQISPEADTLDLLKSSLTGGMPELVNSVEEMAIGVNPVWRVVVRNQFNESETHTLYVFRPTPDRLFFVSVFPETAVNSRDVQVILESLSFSPDQAVQMPASPPSSPIIPMPQECSQPRIIGAP